MKKQVLLFMMALLPIVASAYDAEIDGIYYSFNQGNKTAGVTGRTKKYKGDVIIPESVTYNSVNYSVTTIGERAFSGCSGLTSVTIPNSVTSIGWYAFNGCSGLTSVTIPNSVTSIGGYAFASCSGLTSVTIPNSVTYIGGDAFHGCESLTSVDIPNSVTSIGSNAFDGCSGLKSVTIGNSVTSIGRCAFYGCTGLTSVTIPNSVTSIGEAAFSGCSGLTSVTIGNSVTSIGEWAFRDCSVLTSVTIPNSVTYLYRGAFFGCSGLTSVTIGNSVTSIGYDAFSGCSGLTSVTILCPHVGDWFKGNKSINKLIFGDKVTSIGQQAFFNCSGLTSVTIPNSVTSIGSSAFSWCSGLTSVTIPNSVTSISESSFSGCSGLTSVTIPNSVTSIGDEAFSGCRGMTSVTIPESVESIGMKAFIGCSGLTSLTIPNSVTSIGEEAFEGCRGMTSVTIPESVTSIGKYAFYNCSGLTSVTIGNGVTSIGERAFSGCSSLTSLTIGNGVTSIGERAFSGCSSLTSLTIEDGEESLEFGSSPFAFSSLETLYLGRNISYSSSSPFAEITTLSSLTIGGNMTSIGYKAFYGFSGLTSVTIGDGVTNIGDRAFSGCKNLTEVTIGNGMTSIDYNAFQGCDQLSSVLLSDNIVSISEFAFSSNTKLHVNKGSKTLLTLWNLKDKNGKLIYRPYEKESDMEILAPSFSTETTQTTAKVKIINWDDGYTYSCNGVETTEKEFNYVKQKPAFKQDLTLVVSKDDVQYVVSGSYTTQSLLPRIEEWTATASSISAVGAYTEDDAKVVAQSIQFGAYNAVDGNEVSTYGLDPDSRYTVNYYIVVDYGGENTATYTGTGDVYTQSIRFSTAQPKVVSEGNVIVSSTANLDENEENVGFEWRCIDWTDEFPSNTGTAYLYDGTIEGYIKNMNIDKLWKCRPYYLSDRGIYHYGDWMGIDPTNTSYFEPTVHTYSKVTIKGNTALVKGYALSGTDEVKVQGFKYWKTGKGGGIHHKVIAVPTDAMTVEVNNKQQTLTTTLSDLEYDSEYCCVAFLTTIDGSTFYGEEQTFVTGEYPSDIESVEAESPSDESVIEVARYNINGQQIDAPQKGVNIIRYSDGTSTKIYVK